MKNLLFGLRHFPSAINQQLFQIQIIKIDRFSTKGVSQ